MRYAETLPPPHLAAMVKAVWTLDCGPQGAEGLWHSATPDGCVEIIHRLRGRSTWGGEQPACFVAGVITRPAALHFSDGAAFVGLRLWPWAWNGLARIGSSELVDSWRALDEAAPGLPPPPPDDPLRTLAASPCIDDEIGRAVLGAETIADLTRRTGKSRRWLQRWFASNVGVAPRAYLRLLRFQNALQGVQATASSLADEAAAHGYADQSHMAREFRSLAGAPTGVARRAAKGPFI